MIRKTVRIAMLLLAGVALNVALAWGGMMVATVGTGQMTMRSAAPGERWWVSVPTDWPAAPSAVLEQDASAELALQQIRSVASRLLFRASRVEQLFRESSVGAGAGRNFHLHHIRCGSPMPSMQLSVGWVDSGGAALPIRLRQVDSGFNPQGQLNIRTPILPIRPVWPGFAVNTLCYAALLGVLLAIPGWVRIVIRRRRGLCIHCGYPIGVSELCTECGELPT